MSALIGKIERILTETYSVQNYVELMTELLEGMQIVAPNNERKEYSNFSSHIVSSTHVGTYTCPDRNKIIILSVELKKQAFVENSRSTQRQLLPTMLNTL